jgi:hypothetical protein
MSDQIPGLLCDVATARRTLQMARDSQPRLGRHAAFDGMVLGLIACTQAAESRLADAINANGGAITDEHGTKLTVEFSDRRSTPRPAFIVHRVSAPEGRRDAFAA